MSNLSVSYSLIKSYDMLLSAEDDYCDFYSRSSEPSVEFEDFYLERLLSFYSGLFKKKVKPEYLKDDLSMRIGNAVESNLYENGLSEIIVTSNTGKTANVILNDDFLKCYQNLQNISYKKQVEIKGKVSSEIDFKGYADIVTDTSIIDIKTTSNFNPSNYDGMQLGLYDSFMKGLKDLYYYVFSFKKSETKSKGIVYTMDDLIVIESEPLTDVEYNKFCSKCYEIYKNYDAFTANFEQYKNYFL